MQKEISVERNEGERSYKKYDRVDQTLSIVETITECGIAAGTVGIAILASVVESAVGFVLERVSIGLGGMAMKYASYKITQHHRKSRLLNTIESNQRRVYKPRRICFNQRRESKVLRENNY